MGTVYTIFALCFFTINMATMLKGAAKVVDQAVGGKLPGEPTGGVQGRTF